MNPYCLKTSGARPHPARAVYLQGLSRSQICVIIWKESYGYIDLSLGISGIEDEYRQAQQQGHDILLYIKKSAPRRDERLTSLIGDARTAVTTFSYEDETTLGDQIRADISSIISGAYIDRFASRADRLLDPAAVDLAEFFRPERRRFLVWHSKRLSTGQFNGIQYPGSLAAQARAKRSPWPYGPLGETLLTSTHAVFRGAISFGQSWPHSPTGMLHPIPLHPLNLDSPHYVRFGEMTRSGPLSLMIQPIRLN